MAKCPWDYVEADPVGGTPNVPTPEGEALGIEMARLTENARPAFEAAHPDAPPPCDECAFIKGTIPNRCPSTLMNALKCVMEGEPFYCHKGVTDPECPKRLCGGYQIAVFGANYGEAPHQETRGQSVDEPLRTVTPANNTGVLVAPCIARQNHGEKQWNSVEEPATTITSQGNKHALVSAFLSKYHGQKANESRCTAADAPANTLDTQNRFGVASAHLVKFRGDSKGSAADTPLPTITSGDGAARPAGAAHAMGVCLTQFRGTNAGNGGDPREPMPTITAQGFHVAEVRAFLIKYFGTNIGQSIDGPMQTQTSKHRFGLVTVEGQPYEVIDIGLRMLTPRELARAQGFPDDYILIGSKSNQVAKIGNSVCPPIAEAIVRANLTEAQEAEVA